MGTSDGFHPDFDETATEVARNRVHHIRASDISSDTAQSEGLFSADGDATSIADLFITLMPGMLVTRHLYQPTTAARLAEGMVAFARADSQ